MLVNIDLVSLSSASIRKKFNAPPNRSTSKKFISNDLNESNSFLSNSTYRITFAANNYETANLISQLCGNKTVEQESYGKAKLFKDTGSTNVSFVQRALLLPQEVIQLPRDEQIILIESFPPIKSKKIKYFQDPDFKKRLLPQTLVPNQSAKLEKTNIKSFIGIMSRQKEADFTDVTLVHKAHTQRRAALPGSGAFPCRGPDHR